MLTRSSLTLIAFSFFSMACTNPLGSDDSKVDQNFSVGAPTSIAAVTNLSAAYGSGPSINLSWDASIGQAPIVYTVYRSTSAGSGYAALSACSNISSTTCQDLTISNGTTYYYTVASTNSAGTASSSEVSLMPLLPSVPVLSKISVTSGVSLSWTASTGAANLTYTVKRATISSGPYTSLVAGLNTTAYVDTTAVAGTTYYYVVAAVNPGGTATSNEITATPLSAFSLTSVVVNGSGSVSLTWSSSSGASSYTVKYGTATGVYGTTVTAAGVSPQTISGLTPGTTYYFMVQAINATDSVYAASELSAVPISSFSITSSLGGVGQVTLNWGTSVGATSYTVKYGSSTGSYTTTVSTSASSPTTVTGLSNGTSYYFMVTAVNSSGSLNATAELARGPDMISSDCSSLSANAPFAFGDGSSGNPFLICNLTQFRKLTNADGTTTPTAASAWASGVHYKLLADMTLTGLPSSGATSVKSIGTTPGFSGQLHGNGFKIINHQRSLFQDLLSGSVVDNLTLHYPSGAYFYFSPVGSSCTNSTLNSISVTNAALASDSLGEVAGLVKTASGCTVDSANVQLLYAIPTDVLGAAGLIYSSNGSTISNSSTSGVFSNSGPYFGGLIAISSGDTISNSHSTLTSIAYDSFGDYFGGLVASSTNTTITNSYFGPSSFNHYTMTTFGGLVAQMTGGSITNSYTANPMNQTYSNDLVLRTGGLVGELNSGTISNCYSEMNLSSLNTVGGLIGLMNAGTVSKSSSRNNTVSYPVSGSSSGFGGFVGLMTGGTIQTSYSTSNVNGPTTNFSGGFVGSITNGTITNSYAKANTAYVFGGFAGSVSSSTISSCYSYVPTDVDTHPFIGAAGGVNTCSGNYYRSAITDGTNTACGGNLASPLTTAQFGNSANFTGWDFTTIWQLLVGYPTLR